MAWKKTKIEEQIQPIDSEESAQSVAAVFQPGRQVRNTDLRLPVPDGEILSARVLADGRIGIVTINGRKLYFTPAADPPAVAAPEA